MSIEGGVSVEIDAKLLWTPLQLRLAPKEDQLLVYFKNRTDPDW